MTPDRVVQAKRMRDELLSFRLIGQALGVSEITIRRALAAAAGAQSPGLAEIST